jgi:hypothetical protein
MTKATRGFFRRFWCLRDCVTVSNSGDPKQIHLAQGHVPFRFGNMIEAAHLDAECFVEWTMTASSSRILRL